MIKHSLNREPNVLLRSFLLLLSNVFELWASECVCARSILSLSLLLLLLLFYMFILFVRFKSVNSAHFYYTLIVVTGVETDILRNQTWYAVSNGSQRNAAPNRKNHHRTHKHTQYTKSESLIADFCCSSSSSRCVQQSYSLLAFASSDHCLWLLTCSLNGFFVLFHFTCAYRSKMETVFCDRVIVRARERKREL